MLYVGLKANFVGLGLGNVQPWPSIDQSIIDLYNGAIIHQQVVSQRRLGRGGSGINYDINYKARIVENGA